VNPLDYSLYSIEQAEGKNQLTIQFYGANVGVNHPQCFNAFGEKMLGLIWRGV